MRVHVTMRDLRMGLRMCARKGPHARAVNRALDAPWTAQVGIHHVVAVHPDTSVPHRATPTPVELVRHFMQFDMEQVVKPVEFELPPLDQWEEIPA